MILEQIPVTSMAVFCYLIGDEKSKEGALIDPAGDFDRIFKKIDKHGLKIKWIINTHGHFDHTSGNDHIMKKTDAGLLIHESDGGKLGSLTNRFLSKTIGGKSSPGASRFVKNNDTIEIGALRLKVIHTPGHSKGSISLYIKGHIFTGDTLFTEGMGRTDLGDSSYEKIMDSIKNKILTLPGDTVVWPGHDYGRLPKSTVREQKKYYL